MGMKILRIRLLVLFLYFIHNLWLQVDLELGKTHFYIIKRMHFTKSSCRGTVLRISQERFGDPGSSTRYTLQYRGGTTIPPANLSSWTCFILHPFNPNCSA
jgi:hypothetical protein